MSWLEELISKTAGGVISRDAAKEHFTSKVLNLIEQSKDKDLPLHWLTKEIKAL